MQMPAPDARILARKAQIVARFAVPAPTNEPCVFLEILDETLSYDTKKGRPNQNCVL